MFSRACRLAMAGALISLSVLTVQGADARGGRGGGGFRGGGMSMSHGGGFSNSGTFTRGGSYSRPGAGGSGTRDVNSRPGGGGSGTRWRPDCPKCSDGWNGWVDHPIAAGIAIGAVAGATAAAIGSAYYALPPGCEPYPYYSYTYYSCGTAWYQPQYEGETIVYVTVPDPKTAAAPPPP